MHFIHSFVEGSDRLSLGTLSSRRSSKSSGGSSFPLTQPQNIIGEVVEVPDPGIPLDRRLSDISKLAARESIESPRRTHMAMFAGDQSEQTFALGINKRSSLAQGVDLGGEHGFATPSGLPVRQGDRDRPRRSNSRTRSSSLTGIPLILQSEVENTEKCLGNTFNLTLGETSGTVPEVIAPTSHTVPETSASTVPETSVSTIPEDTPAQQESQTQGQKKSSCRSKHTSDLESMVPDTDIEKPPLSMPVSTTPKSNKKKGKGRRKATSPKKKVSEENNNKDGNGRYGNGRQSVLIMWGKVGHACLNQCLNYINFYLFRQSNSADENRGASAASTVPHNVPTTSQLPALTPGTTSEHVELDPCELNLTPPHTPSQQVEVGTQVMAMWKDKHYYSGQVKACTKSGTYKIAFDDGNVKSKLSFCMYMCN